VPSSEQGDLYRRDSIRRGNRFDCHAEFSRFEECWPGAEGACLDEADGAIDSFAVSEVGPLNRADQPGRSQ
jgi:hypothetical protein